MRKILLFSSVLLISFGFYLFLNDSKQETSYTELRENHEQFIKNHPFSKSLLLSKEERKANGIPPNKYFEQEYLLEMNPRTGRAETEKLYALQEKLQKEALNKETPGTETNMWEERGPKNVPGRTRAILFDPNDTNNQRVFAGGVGGGLWVNENIEESLSEWEQVSIPENLAISSITYDTNNPQNMFVGTGESYVQGSVNGNGIWRSTDGGNVWEHVFGGSTGETYYNGNASLTVNSPASIAGLYSGIQSNSDDPLTEILTEDLVLADDGSAAPTEACGSLVNGAEINGKIAVIERGECYFVDKIMNAQNAGAIAVIMINNVAGTPIIMNVSTGTSITIPAFMISQNDGQILMNAMTEGTVNASFSYDEDNDPAGTLVPGAFHVNDIRTRDNLGTTEIYAAITDSYYTGGAILGAGTYGLYKSIDNGESWEKLILPLTDGGNEYMPNDIEIGADNKIWIGTTKSSSYANGGGTVLSSTDGINFEVVYTVPGDSERTELALSATNPNKLYVLVEHVTYKVQIYKTTDAFATTPTSLSKPNDADPGIPSDDFTRGQAFYDLMIAVDPNNDEIVYVGGVDSFRSSNGGGTWQQMSKWSSYISTNAPYVHADQHELVFHPTDSDKGIMATDGGVFYANSFSGAVAGTYNSISSREWFYNTTQFYNGAIGQNTSADLLLAGAQDNGSFLNLNTQPGSGNIFSEIRGGDGMYCFIDKDGEYMITSNPYNKFYKHSSTGEEQGALVYENYGTFVNIATLDSNLDILYSNASTSSSDRISRISNITGSWSRTNLIHDLLAGGPSAMKISPYTTTSSTLFVGTTRGKLIKVTNANASATWTDITGDQFFGSISAINFGANEDEIMLTFHNYGVQSIWFTQDGGITWQEKEGDFPDIPVKDILMNPLQNDEVIIATDLGVWKTDNFYAVSPNWVRSQNGMQNVKVTSFDLRTADNTVLASTYGRGLFTGKFTRWPVNLVENNLSKALSVYPTASNGTVFVKTTELFTNTTVSVFDTQGKNVYNTSLDLSLSENQLNLNLNTGIYFIKFTNTGLESTHRIIIE